MSREHSYLSRAFGIAAQVEIDYRRRELEPGDVVLLTTDGIHDYVPADALVAIVSAADGDLQAAARALADEAHRRGSPDNLTVQLLRVDGLPPPGAIEALWRGADLPLPSRLHPGAVLDGYRMVRELHASHRSHVWLAEDGHADDLPVILKIPAVDVQHDRDHLNRLLLEEWIARRVDNPHVLKAPPETCRRQSLYAISEYIDARTLAEWMRENPRPRLDTVRGIVEQIVSGLRALHRKGILHQDLRPENVLIDATGKVTLIDFGSARVEGINELGGAGYGGMLGTEQYSAPELFLGEEGSIRSELYSLGVITYQMLTGHLPFGAQVAAIRDRSGLFRLRYQPATTHNADIPVWLDSVLRKAVHPRAEQRHAALSEFVLDLRQPRQTSERPAVSMPAGRHPALLWQAACLVLLLLNLGLLLR
jgi:serine/threonine protein kinase